eukprot:Phypoly_transcript_14542.p2 GENE.Phypoly_transcript_14542~~Phypoly_transcript_14542.p2  ORF type:complete len:111 (+),score=11.59 Phypoly_transcript_14542:319-651(+)
MWSFLITMKIRSYGDSLVLDGVHQLPLYAKVRFFDLPLLLWGDAFAADITILKKLYKYCSENTQEPPQIPSYGLNTTPTPHNKRWVISAVNFYVLGEKAKRKEDRGSEIT